MIKHHGKANLILGWIAVGISTMIASLWAFWGIVENFHEGWYHESLMQNILLMFIQYLLLSLVFVILTIISIYWRKIGGFLFLLATIGLGIFFRGASIPVLATILPVLVILGLLFWFGRPEPRKYACLISIIIPAIIIVGIGTPNLIRVSQRENDGDFSARLIKGNGVELVWAPRGPGWPDSGVSWEKASNICLYLSADGMTIEDTPQNIWRLPTIEEATGSMTRKGINAGGSWDPDSRQAAYAIEPDKETPLWNPNLKIIYYWTAEEMDAQKAYMIAYNGQVHARHKQGAGYLGFRAVKLVDNSK